MKNILKKIIHYIKKTDKGLFVVAALVLTYSSYFTYFTFQRHMNFYSGRYDLGNMDQTIWNTLHGKFFLFTNPDFDQELSRLSVHSDFLLILLTPFYLIWADPRMLLLIQSIVIGSGAFFIYLLGRKVLAQKAIPIILALSYLINPYLQEQNIFDFHAVSLATTFLLGAFYFLYNKRYRWFFVFAFLAAITKEHIFVIVGLLSLYAFFIQKKRWGIVLCIICFAAFYLLVGKFIPEARNTQHFALSYYQDFGDSPKEIIQTFFTDPIRVVALVYNNGLFPYLQSLFSSVGFISVFSPLYFVFALPEFFINMLSQKEALRSSQYHYAAAIIPFVYISAIFGLRNISRLFPYTKTTVILFIYIFVCALYSAWAFGPLPGAKNPDLKAFQQTGNEEKIHSYLRTITSSTSVAATNNIAAHLVHREKIYTIQNGLKKAELVLFLVPEFENPKTNYTDTKLAQKLLTDKKYKLVYRVNNFLAFQRVL